MKRITMVLAIWTSMCAYAFGQNSLEQQNGHHHRNIHSMHRMASRNNAHGRNWNKGYNRNNRNGEHTIRRSRNDNP